MQTVRMERQVPFAAQVTLKEMDRRAVLLVGTLSVTIVVAGVMLTVLLGPKHPVARALNLGFAAAILCLICGSAVFYVIRQIRERHTNDLLSAENLRSRLEYEEDCVRKLLALAPTEQGLERTVLELEAQSARYAGHSGARNEFFRSYKDLLLAGFLFIGLTPENAAGGLSLFFVTIRWVGAALLVVSFWAGVARSARLSRYTFWLSVIALARFRTRLAAAGKGDETPS